MTVKALDNVSFSIEEGDMVAVIGASGSGKTTLLNIIGLLDCQDSRIVRREDRVTLINAKSRRNAAKK